MDAAAHERALVAIDDWGIGRSRRRTTWWMPATASLSLARGGDASANRPLRSADTITFADGIRGGTVTIAGTTELPTITDDLTIAGGGTRIAGTRDDFRVPQLITVLDVQGSTLALTDTTLTDAYKGVTGRDAEIGLDGVAIRDLGENGRSIGIEVVNSGLSLTDSSIDNLSGDSMGAILATERQRRVPAPYLGPGRCAATSRRSLSRAALPSTSRCSRARAASTAEPSASPARSP